MDEKKMEELLTQYDYCEQCLWHDGCAGEVHDEYISDKCFFFTSYTDSVSEDSEDPDERSYFDELAYRQRAYAAIIYEMED